MVAFSSIDPVYEDSVKTGHGMQARDKEDKARSNKETRLASRVKKDSNS